jgi:hypothetical protein
MGAAVFHRKRAPGLFHVRDITQETDLKAKLTDDTWHTALQVQGFCELPAAELGVAMTKIRMLHRADFYACSQVCNMADPGIYKITQLLVEHPSFQFIVLAIRALVDCNRLWSMHAY